MFLEVKPPVRVMILIRNKIDKIILAGGLTLTPGFIDYLSEKIKKEIVTIDPFSDISYPPALKETIKKIGPRYAIAVGLALREKFI